MRIYTRSGDLAFKAFTFPDSQPHFILETYDVDFKTVTIELALKSPNDIIMLLLVASVLRQHGYSEINLDIRYLLGARMDRAISSMEPFTLDVVARLINGAGFSRVRILDCHSEVGTRLIRNSENVLPVKLAQQAVISSGARVLIVPDHGAGKRVQEVWQSGKFGTIIYCDKTRDPNTGALSGFRVNNYEPEKDGTSVMIIDDICDGGNTFIGLAKELRKAGAKKVYLFITHGVFSKGTSLVGIDGIYTTDSYFTNEIPSAPITIIPISMKDM